MEKTIATAAIVMILNALLLSSATATQNAEPMSSADAAAFLDYLQRHKLTAQWQGNPTPISSEEIRAAYPGQRFYYTYRRPPNPPGAATATLQQTYNEQLAEYRKHSLRLTVAIDAEGQLRALRAPSDFNAGLAPVSTDESARVAAAAILSLVGDQHAAPGVISAREVAITRSNGGWVAVVMQPRGVTGKVEFDQHGRCVAITKRLNYSPPVPP